MSGAESSRFVAFWASAEHRARVWFWLWAVQSLVLLISLATTHQLLRRPREVIRIGGDGIPTLVRINEARYTEPNEVEIRSFVTRFVVLFARADSHSVVNDYVEAARMMAPQLREAFKRQAVGVDGQAGAIAVIESLERRTQIDPETLEIQIDKRPYPWHVSVRGVRQIVDGAGEEDQPVELTLRLVRASREEILEGMLVEHIDSRGAAIGSQDQPR